MAGELTAAQCLPFQISHLGYGILLHLNHNVEAITGWVINYSINYKIIFFMLEVYKNCITGDGVARLNCKRGSETNLRNVRDTVFLEISCQERRFPSNTEWRFVTASFTWVWSTPRTQRHRWEWPHRMATQCLNHSRDPSALSVPSYLFGCLQDADRFTQCNRGNLVGGIAATLTFDRRVLVDRYLPETPLFYSGVPVAFGLKPSLRNLRTRLANW